MAFDDILSAAAGQAGIQQEFWDIFGQRHATSPETNRSILTALGFDCTSEASLTSSIARREDAEWTRGLPPVLVVSEGKPAVIPVRTLAAALAPGSTIRIELRTEQGDPYTWNLDSRTGAHGTRTIAGALWEEREFELPVLLPPGYHTVAAAGSTMRLAVAPERAFLLREFASGKKYAGLGVMLYGLRSGRNWGCGDFRDLRALIDWAVPNLGVAFIALNPLHAIPNRRPFNTSPYLPSSVFWRNFIYLDIEAIPGYERIRCEFESEAMKAKLGALRGSEIVEYEDVAALKERALRLIFETAPPAEQAVAWIKEEGELLRLYALWRALDEHFHAADPNIWIWPDWPEAFRDPSSQAVAEFAAGHESEMLFHSWVQWLIDGQIGEVQAHARAAGMPIGLYHDLALATDRCGADLWAHRDFYISGARTGAPPDDFSPSGQDWSFPPPNSRHHRDDGYRLYIASIRKALRHGGALRIDHVMRLFRLYWIPEAHDARHGAYVRDRAHDLVGILALESARQQAIIVGEDLGTVEPQVRETLAATGILSYRLLYFERENGRFRAPEEYPAQALASSTTHDLPTIAGFWSSDDIAARLRSGMIDVPAAAEQTEARGRDKHNLLNALTAAGLLSSEAADAALHSSELTPELHHAIVGYLASTASLLWLVNQEDLTRERSQQNLPGTTAQYPNWSRKMRWTLEDLATLPEARDCAAMVRHWIESSDRHR
jgi:4-alpha-glucanotransferase